VSKNILGLSVTSAVMLWTDVAFAACVRLPWFPPCDNGGGGDISVPEIDGSAGVMAMALVASIAAIIYNRTRG
jgi:hypothetical protein